MPGYVLGDGVTLKNKLGASSPNALESLEEGFVAARLVELALGMGPAATFDAAHLRALHHHLFQDVYEWAGHDRGERFEMSDGEIATMPMMSRPGHAEFVVGPRIAPVLEDTFRALHAEGCLAGLPREEFAASAAGFFGRINTIHAFREGNGRTQRAFFEVLARAAGHRLDFGVVSRERMTAASIAAHEQGDASMLTRLFVEISDPGRIDALRTAQVALDRAGFDWRDRYMSTTEGGRSYGLTMAGRSGDHFMALDGTRGIVIGMASDLPAPIPDRGRPFRLVTATSKPWSRDGLPGDDEDRRPDDAGPADPSIR